MAITKKAPLRIRTGTKVHCIYETAATKPGDFTVREIYLEVKKQYPAVKISHVENLFSKWAQVGFIKKTGKKKKIKGATRKTTAWYLDLQKPQPVIIGAAKKPAAKKRPVKKGLPAEIDALALGEAVIDYINHLQSRVSDLALDVRSIKDKAATQERALKREVGQLTYQIDGLKKNNADLQKRLADSQKRKGLKLDPIIDFKARQGHNG